MANPNVKNEDATDVTSTTEPQNIHSPNDAVATTEVNWLNYLLMAAAACIVSGTILVLWGDHQNSLWTVATGAVLFTIATFAWIGAFLIVSVKILRIISPALLRWFRNFL